jgi:hypothetical protein
MATGFIYQYQQPMASMTIDSNGNFGIGTQSAQGWNWNSDRPEVREALLFDLLKEHSEKNPALQEAVERFMVVYNLSKE